MPNIIELGQKVKAKYPQYNDLSDQEVGQKVKAKYPEYADFTDVPQTEQPASKSLIGQIAEPRLQKVREGVQRQALGQQTPAETFVQAGGQGIGIVGDVALKAAGVVAKTAAPKLVESVQRSFDKLPKKQGLVQKGIEKVGTLSPRTQANIEAGVNIAGVLPVERAAAFGAKAVAQTGERAITGLAKKIPFRNLEKTAAQKVEQEALLKAGASDARVAAQKLEGGKVVSDPIAKEVIRQGVDEADVALIKTGSRTDRSKMRKMLDIRERQLTNKRVTERASDVSGETFLQQAKFIEKKNKDAGKRLDMVARDLAGKKADPMLAISQFGENLDKAGVKVKEGKLSFKGSDFEGIPGVQNSLKLVWDRSLRAAKTGDALELHRMKRFIDNIVEYGVEGEGLRGNAERIIKQLRHDVDAVLDANFPKYNQVNSVFSETIQELNKIGQSMGKRFKLSGEFANAQLGTVMRRILSQAKSRSEILQLLESTQKLAQKHGMKIDDDVVRQVMFADTLEKVLGSEAPTSFLGGIERGVGQAEQALSAGGEILAGNITKGTIKAVKFLSDATRGVNQKNKLEALKALLGELDDLPKTVFGKKVIK